MNREYTLDELIDLAATHIDAEVRRLAVTTAYAMGKRDQHHESFIERFGTQPHTTPDAKP